MSTGMLALIILAVVLLQIAALVVLGHHRRKRKGHEVGPRPSEAPTLVRVRPITNAVEEEPGAAGPAWDGFKEFVVQRRVVEDESRTICSFYLEPVDGHPLPTYKPGQYLTFRLQIPDPVSGEPKTVVRCYSLSDRPEPEHYRVTIKRVPTPAKSPGAPPGLSSNFFHDQVEEGTKLSAKAPSGHFFLTEDESLPIVLVAGGIGITPMLSILNAVLDAGDAREIRLYYGVRNGTEHIMKAHLGALQKAHPRFHLHVCYSRPGEGDVEGINYRHRGHVDIVLLRSTLRLTRYQFYVCGPQPMMETLVPALEEWVVAPGDIHYESFGPASLTRHDRPAVTGAEGSRVSFSKSGKSIAWTPGTESLLELAEANGIDVESGCRAGSCGSCQTPLEAGEVEYSQQPDADIEPGHCLLCVSVPKGDITLQA